MRLRGPAGENTRREVHAERARSAGKFTPFLRQDRSGPSGNFSRPFLRRRRATRLPSSSRSREEARAISPLIEAAPSLAAIGRNSRTLLKINAVSPRLTAGWHERTLGGSPSRTTGACYSTSADKSRRATRKETRICRRRRRRATRVSLIT